MLKTAIKKIASFTAADWITVSRLCGSVLLFFTVPFSSVFYIVYTICGLSDAIDGSVARATGTASDFGAKLDSTADMMFYAAMLLHIFPALWELLSPAYWWCVAAIIAVRVASYIVAAVKYKRFASQHTILNKATGLVLFLVPYLFHTDVAAIYCAAVCAVAAAASIEELLIHSMSREYDPKVKSVFMLKK